MALVFVRRPDGTGALIPDGRVAATPDHRLVTTGGWLATKRDSHGNTIASPMGRDPQGNYQPYQTVVTACRSCGRNNYSAEYSTCDRCG